MCDKGIFIAKSVKCMMTMRWVMAWFGNGFGCSMKTERTCMMRCEVGVHLWWNITWCVGQRKSLWGQTFHSFSSLPALSSNFKDSTLWHCQKSFGLSEIVCTLCVPGALWGAQKTTCCMRFYISDALSEERNRRVETWVSHITPGSEQQSLQ